jgi:hypothetical protein
MGKNLKKFKGSLKLAISVLSIVFVSVFTVLADLIAPDVNDKMLSPGYWIELIVINIAVIAILFIVKSLKEDSEKRYNKKYLVLSGTLDEAFKAINKNGAAEGFKDYLKEDNAKAKREAYEKILHQRKGKIIDSIHEAEAKFNNKRLIKGLDVIAEPKTKKLIKLRLKLAFVEARIAKIDEELPFVKVNYIHVTHNSIFGDCESKSKKDRDTSPHKMGFSLIILLKRAILIIAVSLAFFLSAKRLDAELSVVFFFNIALRLFQVTFGIYSGIDAGSEYIRINLCDALKERISIVQIYFDRLRSATTEESTQDALDLHVIEEEVTKTVEMDLEEIQTAKAVG